MIQQHRINKDIGLNLDVIADSGQCFRLNRFVRSDGSVFFNLITRDKFVRMEDRGTYYSFKCEPSDAEFWVDYLDLLTDYKKFNTSIQKSDDGFLKRALDYGHGMRILRQDNWESIISFLISQNNNIPRIKKSVEAICKKFGHPILYTGEIYFSFPTQEEIKDITFDDLQDLGLGYRDRYILNACKQDWSKMNPSRSTLESIPGIGPKVASCILLYGYHKLDEYPIDTWMRRLIDDVYHGDFDPDIYHDFCGYIQQLQFYYYRHLKGKSVL